MSGALQGSGPPQRTAGLGSDRLPEWKSAAQFQSTNRGSKDLPLGWTINRFIVLLGLFPLAQFHGPYVSDASADFLSGTCSKIGCFASCLKKVPSAIAAALSLVMNSRLSV